jgi:hypothetical protein
MTTDGWPNRGFVSRARERQFFGADYARNAPAVAALTLERHLQTSRQLRSLLSLARTGTIATMIAACTSSGTQRPADVPPLQMNDLSVLLPLATSAGDSATYPSPTSPGAGGAALLPEALYASDPLADEIPYDGLRVVAFRLDPCFGHIGEIESSASCDDQIRLVFQPLQLVDAGLGAGSAVVATDAAIHVSYSITRQ